MASAVPGDVQGDVTQLLIDWRGGDQTALDRLVPIVYDELRRVAHRCLRSERSGNTMQTTGLVHETYLRLVQSTHVQWRDRAHFFALSAQLMRRVLVDQARRRAFQKRGGAMTRVPIDDEIIATPERSIDLLALDEALRRMSEVAPRKCQIVEMRYFAGLTLEETAAVLEISTDTVKREWRTAKLWLARALKESHGSGAVESD